MNAPRRLAVLLVCVLSSGWLAAQTTFTWTGNGTTFSNGSGNAQASTGANWVGGTAPTSTDDALLSFGASFGLSAGGDLTVQLPYSFTARGLAFAGALPDYYFYSDDAGRLRLGEAGLTLSGEGQSQVKLASALELTASQTWTINGGMVRAYGSISQATSTTLTKTGEGDLLLNSSSSTFGGLNVQGGTVYVGASSSLGDSNLISGPLGSGRLTLADYTQLAIATSEDVVLHNPISLGSHVTIGGGYTDTDVTLAGDITLLKANTTLRIGADGALFLTGGISNVAGDTATSLTFTGNEEQNYLAQTTYSDSQGFPVAVLSGTNTYTGGTQVDGAGVIFYTSNSLPATGAISAINGGYVGTGFSGGMQAILGHIANKSTFDGALGFDTNPDLSPTPTTFSDTLDLSAFAPDVTTTGGLWGLGSFTKAILTGTITPPSGGNYVFGGGDGTLFVQSNLTAHTGVRVRSEYDESPLTVWLQGNNSFTGKLLSDHSIVVLDSANALPATNQENSDTGRFQLDSGAYVGYTENFTAGGTGTADSNHTVTPAEFISRLAGTAYNDDSILGLDSAGAEGRTIAAPINLSALNDVFIGTSTHVHLNGTITAPRAGDATGKLSVTGVNGGWLTIDAPLLAPTEVAPGVVSLNLGGENSDYHRRGYVELTSGSSTFTGGTTFNSGYLLLGASSTVNGSGAITQGPLGTGTLTVTSYYDDESPATIAATTSGLTLHNPIHFDYGSAQFGVSVTSDSENPAAKAQSYTSHGLTLNGNLSGSASLLSFTGNGTFTLNGNNSALTAYWLQIGTSLAEGTPLVVANTDTAFGANGGNIYLGSGADLQFTTAAPVIGDLTGGYTDAESSNRSFVALASGSALTITQNYSGTLYANIGGTPANFSGNQTSSVNASLVKEGSGTLTLAGQNTYTGTTTVKNGLLLANNANAFGSGTIVLNGGGVGATSGITLTNPITFGTAGGTLGGNGAIASAITAGPNVKIAPGNSPGQLTFTSNLTFAGGGTASFDIANFASSAGTGWDQIVVSSTGSFAISATIANPFTIEINSWSSTSNSLGALTTDFSVPVSLALLQTSAPITGLIGDGDAGISNLVLNTSNFTAYQDGEFTLSLSTDSTALLLNFTPVPEPSTYALLGTGLLLVAGSVWRSKRARRD
jgi:autotransporter-associated beta strand protein